MNAFNSYPERTKRRKISKEVSKLISEAQSTKNHCNIEDDISNYNISLMPSINGDSLYNMPIGSQVVDFATTTMDEDDNDFSEDVCFDEEFDLPEGVEVTGVSSEFQSESDKLQFSEHSDWLPRAIEDFEVDGDDIDDVENIQDGLKNWALSYSISHAALSALLKTLQPHLPGLPNDARSILHTQRCSDTKTLAGGDYYYFGVKHWLDIFIESSPLFLDIDHITLHVNIDGIPLFSSSNICLWPILGSFNEIEDTVFPIAVLISLSLSMTTSMTLLWK